MVIIIIFYTVVISIAITIVNFKFVVTGILNVNGTAIVIIIVVI